MKSTTNQRHLLMEFRAAVTLQSPTPTQQLTYLESVPATTINLVDSTSLSPSIPPSDTWSNGVLTSARLDNFASRILPLPVQAHLAQPFGKDSNRHSFTSEKCFRHILLPLFKSKFLSCRSTKNLEKASRRARQFQLLRKRYRNVNFSPCKASNATGTRPQQ
jgi:hypothetical protein